MELERPSRELEAEIAESSRGWFVCVNVMDGGVWTAVTT